MEPFVATRWFDLRLISHIESPVKKKKWFHVFDSSHRASFKMKRICWERSGLQNASFYFLLGEAGGEKCLNGVKICYKLEEYLKKCDAGRAVSNEKCEKGKVK